MVPEEGGIFTIGKATVDDILLGCLGDESQIGQQNPIDIGQRKFSDIKP